jgi:hypothetical protein
MCGAIVAGALAAVPASAALRSHHCGTFDFGPAGGYPHAVIVNGTCRLARRVLRLNPPNWKFSEQIQPRPGLPFGVIQATHGSPVITAEPLE